MEYEDYRKIRFVSKDVSSPESWHLKVEDSTGQTLGEYEPCNDDIWLRASQIRFGQNLALENSAVEILPSNRDLLHEETDSFTAVPGHYLLAQMVTEDRHTSLTMIGKTKPIESLTVRITAGETYAARVSGILAHSYEDHHFLEQHLSDSLQISVVLLQRDFDSLVDRFFAKDLHMLRIILSGVRGLYTDNPWVPTDDLKLLTSEHEVEDLPDEALEIPVTGQIRQLQIWPTFTQNLDPDLKD